MKFLILLLLSLNIFAQDCSDPQLKAIPALHEGRVKTLLVMARETVHTLTNKYSYEGMSAIELFCKLNNNFKRFDLFIPIEHTDLKEFLGLKESKININDAISKQEQIKVEIIKQKDNSSYKKALNKLWFRMDKFLKLKDGQVWLIPVKVKDDFSWHTYKDMYANNLTPKEDILNRASIYDKISDTDYKLENQIIKFHIFSVAMLLSILAIIFMVVLRNKRVGITLALLSVAIQISGITLRVLISGRGPVTNMYETVMFSGLGALIIALIIFLFKKDLIYILAGLGYNILCLFMMKFSGGMLNENISPLVPVLRDNFWLSTHVTTIILSYAALALSWMISNITLFKQRFGKITKKEYRYNEGLIYTSVIVGTILLSTGIILGGVWADYSWGRFWGWDPKETWSLIVLLIYMALLHGRGTSWIKPHAFILACAAGFMSVMMAWFGVNYILAAGLHSYGFSEGGAIFLGVFFLVQILFLFLTGKNKTIKESSKEKPQQ